MKSVKIKLLQKGMMTATEVKDRMGRTLLTSGQTITEHNLKTLKAWGITEVNIKDSAGPEKNIREGEQVDIEVSPAIIKEQDALFKFTDRRHPAITELYNVCLVRKVEMRQEEQ